MSMVGGVTAESVGEAVRSELLNADVGVKAVARLTVGLILSVAGEPDRVGNRQERNNRFIMPVHPICSDPALWCSYKLNSFGVLVRGASRLDSRIVSVLATRLAGSVGHGLCILRFQSESQTLLL
jgi:hypothetical protein